MRSSSSSKKVTLEEINSLLNASRSVQDFSEGSKLYSSLYSFILSNEYVDATGNKSSSADDLSPILTTLTYITDAKTSGPSDVKFRFLLLKIIRILSRKVENRVGLPPKCFKSLVQQLQHSNSKISSEGASILLNMCYEKSNVESVIEVGAVELLAQCLGHEDEELKANAAGAIQSIWGQEYVKDHSPEIVIASLARCLSSSNARVCARAVGALHNLSTNLELVLVIRDTNGISPIVHILSTQSGDTARSAAGTIMNISRETESRKIVKEAGAVMPLTKLLFGSDIPSQTSALGALLNDLYDRGDIGS